MPGIRGGFEWGVAVDGEKFVWAKNPSIRNLRIQQSAIGIAILHAHPPSSLLAVLPDGYTIETCPAAESWWREAAGSFGDAENC